MARMCVGQVMRFAVLLLVVAAAAVLSEAAPSDVSDAADKARDTLSSFGDSILDAVTTPKPSLWDRFSSSVQDTYEKAKEGSKKLADRVQDSLGL
jgi:hypothetical protein